MAKPKLNKTFLEKFELLFEYNLQNSQNKHFTITPKELAEKIGYSGVNPERVMRNFFEEKKLIFLLDQKIKHSITEKEVVELSVKALEKNNFKNIILEKLDFKSLDAYISNNSKKLEKNRIVLDVIQNIFKTKK